MKTNNMRWLACAFVAVGTVVAKADEDVITRIFTVKPGGKLILKVDRGSVHVTTSDTDKVDIKITRELKRASAAEAKMVFEQHKIELSSTDNEVKIEAQNPQKHFGFSSPFNRLHVDYTIAIPAKFDIDVETAGGNIDVADLDGKAVVQTSGGNLRVKDAYGPVTAHTSGGNVSAQLSTQPTADCSLTTSGGNVDVLLASNLALDLKARTSGGRVNSDFPGTLNKEKTRLTAKLNGGGTALALETSGGN